MVANKTYSTLTAGEYLGISDRSVNYAIRSKVLPAQKKGKTWSISPLHIHRARRYLQKTGKSSVNWAYISINKNCALGEERYVPSSWLAYQVDTDRSALQRTLVSGKFPGKKHHNQWFVLKEHALLVIDYYRITSDRWYCLVEIFQERNPLTSA